MNSQVHYSPLEDLPASFRASYFAAQQREVTPACIVQPRSAEDVALAVRIIGQANGSGEGDNCIFAIRGGGHGMFAGASSAPNGITIDLRYMDNVSVTEDLKTASLGPGNRWVNVYKALEPFGLTVAGSRDDSVGVGGFLLGGEWLRVKLNFGSQIRDQGGAVLFMSYSSNILNQDRRHFLYFPPLWMGIG